MVQEKPCRTCTDFQTWAKLQKKTYDFEKVSFINYLQKFNNLHHFFFSYYLF